MKDMNWKLNTSNLGKFEEFKRIFAKFGCTLSATHVDLQEIEADHISVIAHKASQMDEGVIVDDTSLEIEDASVGINVRRLLDHLPEYIGRVAIWTVLLAYRQNNEVLIFKGSISGAIVEASGANGFGFDPYFLPDGADKTLAISKPDQFSARAAAVEALVRGEVWAQHPLIHNWNGPWQ